MNIIVAKKDILPALSRAASVAAPKSPHPVISCALLTASKDGLTVSATDLIVSVQESVAAEVRDAGSVAVHARDILDRVKLMPDGPVKMSCVDGALTVSAVGKSRTFKLYSENGEMFPDFATRREDAPMVALPCDAFSKMISAALRCVNPDTTSVQSCVRLRWSSSSFDITATDGRRGLILTSSIDGLKDDGASLLPAKAARELARACEGRGGVVALSPMWPASFAEIDGVMYAFRHSHEAAWYPPIDRIIEEPRVKVTVSRAAMLDGIRVAATSTEGDNRTARFLFSDGFLRVSAECAKGDASESIPVDWRAKDRDVLLNSDMANDIVSATPEDTDITIGLGKDLDPVQILSPGLVGVIMPILPEAVRAKGKAR